MNHAQRWEQLRYRLLEMDLEVFRPSLPGKQDDWNVLNEAKDIAGEPAASLLSALVRMFLKSRKREPYYLDLAASYCFSKGIPPIPTLWRLQGETSMHRERVGEMASQRVQVKKQIAKRGIFNLMGHLIYAEQTLKKSANQAANAFQYVYPDLHPYKASSLQKLYVQDVRKPGIEEQFFREWDGMGLQNHQIGQQIMELIPEASYELRGERR